MLELINKSQTRTVSHEDDGTVYTIAPGALLTVNESVGISILSAWKEVEVIGGDKPAIEVEPWEVKAGPTWEKAKLEFNIDLTKQKKTVGPDRPPVVEPEAPSDAVDTETGRVDEKLTNIHVCTYCQKEYKLLKPLRSHMKKEHGV